MFRGNKLTRSEDVERETMTRISRASSYSDVIRKNKVKDNLIKTELDMD